MRQEAWTSGSSITSALGYLTIPQTQTELDTIAVGIGTSTSDAERTHSLDKRSEQRTVNSVAKASRDSFLRAWRQTLAAQGLGAPEAKLRAKLRKRKASCEYLSAAALACQMHPHLFPRSSGRSSGDALRTYVAEHRENLDAELVRLRGAADAALSSYDDGLARAFQFSWPKSKRAWVEWLHENQTEFNAALREARGGSRRSVNTRLRPVTEVPDSAPLLVAKARRPRVPWAALARNGWYCLGRGGAAVPTASLGLGGVAAPTAPLQLVVLLVVSAGHQKAAYALRETHRGFIVPKSIELPRVLQPLWEVAPAHFLDAAVQA